MDHDNEQCRLENKPFGDLKLLSHPYIVFLGLNQSGPETSSTANHRFQGSTERLLGPLHKQPLTLRYLCNAPFMVFSVTYTIGKLLKLDA